MDADERQKVRLALAALFLMARTIRGDQQADVTGAVADADALLRAIPL